MNRVVALIVAAMLAVTPTADVVCRAVCTPGSTAADVPPCHEIALATADGALLPSAVCQRGATTVAPPTREARNLTAPAPLVTVEVHAFAHAAVVKAAGLASLAERPHLTHASPSSIVLRM